MCMRIYCVYFRVRETSRTKVHRYFDRETISVPVAWTRGSRQKKKKKPATKYRIPRCLARYYCKTSSVLVLYNISPNARASKKKMRVYNIILRFARVLYANDRSGLLNSTGRNACIFFSRFIGQVDRIEFSMCLRILFIFFLFFSPSLQSVFLMLYLLFSSA